MLLTTHKKTRQQEKQQKKVKKSSKKKVKIRNRKKAHLVEERVLQTLAGGQPVRRVHAEHLAQQVQGVVSAASEGEMGKVRVRVRVRWMRLRVKGGIWVMGLIRRRQNVSRRCSHPHRCLFCELMKGAKVCFG